MDGIDLTTALDALAHDIDMLVFRLETKPTVEQDELLRERARLRSELEGLRDRVMELARSDRIS